MINVPSGPAGAKGGRATASTEVADPHTKAERNKAKKARAKANKAKKAADAARLVRQKPKALTNGGVGDGTPPKGQGKGKRQKLNDKDAGGQSICYKWNFGKPCNATPCPHQHCCRICLSTDHAMKDCPQKA